MQHSIDLKGSHGQRSTLKQFVAIQGECMYVSRAVHLLISPCPCAVYTLLID